MEAVIGLLGGGHEIPWVRRKCHKYYSGSLASIFWGWGEGDEGGAASFSLAKMSKPTDHLGR